MHTEHWSVRRLDLGRHAVELARPRLLPVRLEVYDGGGFTPSHGGVEGRGEGGAGGGGGEGLSYQREPWTFIHVLYAGAFANASPAGESMARRKRLEYATCICKFGDKDLIDGVEDVVIPAFFSGKRRTRLGTDWLFHNAELVRYKSGDTCIAFELVKATLLHRDQVWDPARGLIEDQQTLESAPSAIGLLILNDHRLVYFPKTRFAPKLKEFEATFRAIVVAQWHEWLTANSASDNVRTRLAKQAELIKRLPHPRVEVLPLTSKDTIDESLDLFGRVKSAAFELVDTNNEYDPSELFVGLRKRRSALEAETAKLTYSTKSKDGLSISDLKKDVLTATQQGSSRVKLVGEDKEGEPLTQDNADLRVRTEAEFTAADTPSEAAGDMHSALRKLERSGRIKKASSTQDLGERLRGVWDRWRAKK